MPRRGTPPQASHDMLYYNARTSYHNSSQSILLLVTCLSPEPFTLLFPTRHRLFTRSFTNLDLETHPLTTYTSQQHGSVLCVVETSVTCVSRVVLVSEAGASPSLCPSQHMSVWHRWLAGFSPLWSRCIHKLVMLCVSRVRDAKDVFPMRCALR